MRAKAKTAKQRAKNRKAEHSDVLPAISPPTKKEQKKAKSKKTRVTLLDKDTSPSKAELAADLKRLQPLEVSAIYRRGWWAVTIFTARNPYTNPHTGKRDRNYFNALQKAIDQVHKDAEYGVDDDSREQSYGIVGGRKIN